MEKIAGNFPESRNATNYRISGTGKGKPAGNLGSTLPGPWPHLPGGGGGFGNRQFQPSRVFLEILTLFASFFLPSFFLAYLHFACFQGVNPLSLWRRGKRRLPKQGSRHAPREKQQPPRATSSSHCPRQIALRKCTASAPLDPTAPWALEVLTNQSPWRWTWSLQNF